MTSEEAISLYRAIIHEGRRFPGIAQIFLDLAPGQTSHLLADFIKIQMAQGTLRSDDPFEAARALMALCTMGSHRSMLIGLTIANLNDQIEKDATFAVSLFMKAYAV